MYCASIVGPTAPCAPMKLLSRRRNACSIPVGRACVTAHARSLRPSGRHPATTACALHRSRRPAHFARRFRYSHARHSFHRLRNPGATITCDDSSPYDDWHRSLDRRRRTQDRHWWLDCARRYRLRGVAVEKVRLDRASGGGRRVEGRSFMNWSNSARSLATRRRFRNSLNSRCSSSRRRNVSAR